LKYYTKCRDFTDVDVCKEFRLLHNGHVALGIANTLTRVVGCYAHEKRTGVIIQKTEFSLPSMQHRGHAVWINIPNNEVDRLNKLENESIRAAVHGVNHLILAILPIFILCDAKDLGTEHVSPLEARPRFAKFNTSYVNKS